MSRPAETRDFWDVNQWECPIARFAWHVGRGVQEDRPESSIWDDKKFKPQFLPSPDRIGVWNQRCKDLIVKWHGLSCSAPIQQVLAINFPAPLNRVDLSKDPPPLKDVEYMYYLDPTFLTDKQVAKILFWEHLTVCSWIRKAMVAAARARFAKNMADRDSVEIWSLKTAIEAASEIFKSQSFNGVLIALADAIESLTADNVHVVEAHSLPCLGLIHKGDPRVFPVSTLFQVNSSLATAHAAILDRHAQSLLYVPSDESCIPLLPSIKLEDVLAVRPLPTSEKIDSIVKGSIGQVFALYRITSSMLMAPKEEDQAKSNASDSASSREFKYSWLDISREIPIKYRELQSSSKDGIESRVRKFFSSWLERFTQAIQYVIESSGIKQIDMNQSERRIVEAARDLSRSTNLRKEMMLKDVFEGYTRIGVIGAIAFDCALEEFKHDVRSFCAVGSSSSSSSSATADPSSKIETETVSDPVQRREDLFDRLETKRAELARTVAERVSALFASRIEELKVQAGQVFAKEAKDALNRVGIVNRVVEHHNEKIRARQARREHTDKMIDDSVLVLSKADFLMVGKAADAWMKHWDTDFVPRVQRRISDKKSDPASHPFLRPNPRPNSRFTDKRFEFTFPTGEKTNFVVSGSPTASDSEPDSPRSSSSSSYLKFAVMRLDPDQVPLDSYLIRRMPHMAYLSTAKTGECLPAQFRACINQIERCMMLTNESVERHGPRFFAARLSDLAIFWLGQVHKNCLVAAGDYSESVQEL